MAEKWQLKDHERDRQIFARRMTTAAIVIGLLFSALLGKLIHLQVYRYDYFSARSDDNRLHSQYVPPSRGLIFDRYGELLADNQPIFNLTVVRERAGDMDQALAKVRDIIPLTDDEVEQFRNRLRRSRVPHTSVPLRYQLTEAEMARFAVNEHRLPGFTIEAQLVRNYPLGSLTAHAIGYVSEINKDEVDRMDAVQKENYGGTNHIGKTGIERTYEDLLHGQVGYETVEKNNRGQVMRVLDRTDPRFGANLQLHMVAALQRAAADALGDHRGAVVAIEPATGGILAMVSKPGFDPNLFVTGISNRDYRVLVNDQINTPLFDRSTNPYPPGSTIKPMLGLAGLQNGFVDYDFTINDPGFFRLPGVSYRWNDYTARTAIGGGHGRTDLKKAIYQSCDTFFYDLGNRMGIDAMHDFMALFGFGRNFALDIPYARTGVLPSRDWKLSARGEPWYPGDTIHASIGQGYMWVTPLQLATAVAVVANHGRVVQPRLLRAVDGEPYAHRVDPTVADISLTDPDYWNYVEDAMVQVVHRAYNDTFRDYGTAYEAIAAQDRGMPYRMAGKSGTAQVVAISQDVLRSTDIDVADIHKDHALFVSFAPAQNPNLPPQIALAVFVENGQSGSAVAGAISKQIMDAYLLDILKLDFDAIEANAGQRLISTSP